MQKQLREAYARDPEANLLCELARTLCESAMSLEENRGFRIHWLWLTLGLMLFFILCVFLFFSFVRP